MVKNTFDKDYFEKGPYGKQDAHIIRRNYKILLDNAKVVAGYHGIFPNVGSHSRRLYYKLVNKWISRVFDAHHVVNSERRELLTSYGYKNIYYIPNGVDTKKFRPCRKEEKFTILFVGRLTYQKGFDIFTQVIKSLNKRYCRDIEFIIIGTGPMSRMAEKLQVTYGNVKWISRASDEALIECYKKAHILVAPSIFEEFLFTSIEAQACGTPVIASDIPGPRDNIIHGRTT
jgi:glycosyltransferase involved in cell wall biosynthesis